MAHTARSTTVALPAGTGGTLSAYVVGKDGTVLESAPFSDGRAQLQTGKDALKGSRLFIGPPFPKEYPAGAIDAYALTASGAQQVSMNFTGAGEITVHHLPGDIIIVPPFHVCDVVGNVNNTVTLDGVATTGPVCKAQVHICTVEVDRFRNDRRKGNAIVRTGWRLLRFTWHDLQTRPDEVVAEILDALAAP